MFGLIRFAVSAVVFAVLIWFAVTVPIGKRTLWGHLSAIAGTEEAKELADSTKEEAQKVARRVKDELHASDMAPTPRHVRAPLDPVDDHERHKLQKLVKDKTR